MPQPRQGHEPPCSPKRNRATRPAALLDNPAAARHDACDASPDVSDRRKAMAAAYPATFDVPVRERVPRDQAVLHTIIAIVFYWLASGILGFLAIIVAPIVIAVRVGSKGGEKFIQEDGASSLHAA
jgi:hypothetical protein